MIQQLHSILKHSKCHGEEAMDGDNVIHKKREVKKTKTHHVSSPPFILIWHCHIGDIVLLVVIIPYTCRRTESNHLVEKKKKMNINIPNVK